MGATDVGIRHAARHPAQWQAFLWISAGIEILILLPLLYWQLPESPRWLEAHGRHEEAAVEDYERRVQQFNPAPLPEPRGADNPVIMATQARRRNSSPTRSIAAAPSCSSSHGCLATPD